VALPWKKRKKGKRKRGKRKREKQEIKESRK